MTLTDGMTQRVGGGARLVGVMGRAVAVVATAGLVVVVAACTGVTVAPTGSASTPAAPPTTASLSTTTRPTSASATTAPPSPRPVPSATTSRPPAPPDPDPVDPRWRFYTSDTRTWTSPWFAGRHRIMVPFGCTPAPYYDHDARCPGTQGFHHGVDVVMPCGTPLTGAVAGVVASPGGAGALGAAYGPYAFRIRDTVDGVDIVIGHVKTVDVRPGQRVAVGQRIALSSDQGAPDGCHLHFEVRAVGGGLSTARDPLPLLRLTPSG